MFESKQTVGIIFCNLELKALNFLIAATTLTLAMSEINAFDVHPLKQIISSSKTKMLISCTSLTQTYHILMYQHMCGSFGHRAGSSFIIVQDETLKIPRLKIGQQIAAAKIDT